MAKPGEYVLVITGGWSAEREENLLGARSVYDSLARSGTRVQLLDIRSPQDLFKLTNYAALVDYAYLCHTEDLPTIPVLDLLGIPHSASAPWSSIAVSYDKVLTYEIAQECGVPVPEHSIVTNPRSVDSGRWLFPKVVKPVRCGSSIGVSVAQDAQSLRAAVLDALNYDHAATVEEYLSGEEYTVAAFGINVYAMLKVNCGASSLCDYVSKHELLIGYKSLPDNDPAAPTLRIYTRHLATAFEIHGFWRTDYRCGRGAVRVLDVNLLPFLGFCRDGIMSAILASAEEAYSGFLKRVARRDY